MRVDALFSLQKLDSTGEPIGGENKRCLSHFHSFHTPPQKIDFECHLLDFANRHDSCYLLESHKKAQSHFHRANKFGGK